MRLRFVFAAVFGFLSAFAGSAFAQGHKPTIVLVHGAFAESSSWLRVQRWEGRAVLVDLGRTVGILPPEEQVAGERYTSGMRVKVYIASVNLGPKGPEILLSRSHPEMVKKLFTLEIPEIANGSIEIKSIAREAGYRSKVAVMATKENIDPIGSCVGQRGTRIQTIISELGGEKIDGAAIGVRPMRAEDF